jgi:antitoxin (DNA-binding transcriptional repressor) of toxin-antitoxin stability system
MVYRVTFDEALTQLAKLMEAAKRGEDVYIVGDDDVPVKLVPEKPIRRPKFGSAKGLIEMSDDFDEPLEDFKEYME